jgi:hypothetical protein
MTATSHEAVTRNLWWTAAFMAACLVVVTPLGAVDARSLGGVNIWDKPFKFALSLGIHFATLAVLVQLLPLAVRQGWTLRVATTLAVAAAVFEILYIAFQAMRGRKSHFNFDSQIEAALYQAMGAGAVLLILLPFVMGILILRRTPDDGGALRAGAAWGLIASAILTFIVAGTMSISGSHWVGQTAGDANGLPLFGWSREVGDYRPAHFVATHMMQGLPLLGWLIDRTGTGGRWLVFAGLILGSALCIALFVQARMGLPMVPL